MRLDKELVGASTGVLVLSVLANEASYGYQIVANNRGGSSAATGSVTDRARRGKSRTKSPLAELLGGFRVMQITFATRRKG